MTKFCPYCGEELIDNAKFCKSCGKNVEKFTAASNDTFTQENPYKPPVVEKDHTLALVLGIICAFIIPLFGIIFGIYLMTRQDNPKSKTHGIIVTALSVFVWLVSFIIVAVIG